MDAPNSLWKGSRLHLPSTSGRECIPLAKSLVETVRRRLATDQRSRISLTASNPTSAKRKHPPSDNQSETRRNLKVPVVGRAQPASLCRRSCDSQGGGPMSHLAWFRRAQILRVEGEPRTWMGAPRRPGTGTQSTSNCPQGVQTPGSLSPPPMWTVSPDRALTPSQSATTRSSSARRTW